MYRSCVDYRSMNEVTVRDAYPLPRIDECLDSLSGMKWFSYLNVNSGFWQTGMAPEDIEKTDATSLGLYQFNVMPFGLANPPSTFLRLREDVLRGLQLEECLLYLDDIIVTGSTFNQTVERENVFWRPREVNLELEPSKINAFSNSKPVFSFYNTFLMSENWIHTDLYKIPTIKT